MQEKTLRITGRFFRYFGDIEAHQIESSAKHGGSCTFADLSLGLHPLYRSNDHFDKICKSRVGVAEDIGARFNHAWIAIGVQPLRPSSQRIPIVARFG